MRKAIGSAGWVSSTGHTISHNLSPFIFMQNHHSLLYREEECEMLPLLKASPCSFCAWTPKLAYLMFNLNHQHLVEPIGGGS
jgi:aryl-alcohol dehydrogenase-like predicted oxidoreductase